MTQERNRKPDPARGAHPAPGPIHEPIRNSSKRRDRSFAVALGISCALLGALAGFLIPHLWSAYQNSKTTKVTITAPVNFSRMPNNGFGVSGFIQGPTPGNNASLWLIVFHPGEGYYPYSELHIVDDQWNIPPRRIYPWVDEVLISVYEVPNKDSGTLWAYVQNGSIHYSPIHGGLPRAAVLKASVDVYVGLDGKGNTLKGHTEVCYS
jgi:hypothetical protein